MTQLLSPMQTSFPIYHAQPISVQNRGCCISLVEGCTSILKALINKVIAALEGIWQLVSITFRILRSRYWDGVNVPFIRPEQTSLGENDVMGCIVDYFVRQFRVPVDIGPQVGIDPRICTAQFTHPLRVPVEIPEAPDVDIRGLNPMFEQWIAPNDNRIEDEDTPATFEELKQGLTGFVQAVLNRCFMYDEHRVTLANPANLHSMFKHIFSLLSKEDVSRDEKIESLLELARAGHRRCPTRMNESVQVVYERLKGEVAVPTLPDLVAQQLHDLREGILKEMSGGDVHRHQEYLAGIGRPLGIRYASVAYNDDPRVMDDCAPRHAFPLFFRKYTPEKMIETIGVALNGFPRPGQHSHERIERKLQLDVAVAWFLENIPATFHPGEPMDHRKVLYSEAILDQQTNTLKTEAILYMLVRLGVLSS